ncbi:hypothetical protein J1605_021327 [Eschrichtius robustus]|uniref:Uncharacterized protein n=1 Tax=Eschrichtius robustus TaxID=9764 RepID=A0AB34HH91_ESCRO|nr:hypothetical protein J1605_021327 [Eschrichtius robustus]
MGQCGITSSKTVLVFLNLIFWNSLLDGELSLQILSGHQARNRIFPKGSGSAFFVGAWSPGSSSGSPEACEQMVQKCGDATDSGGRDFALELVVYGELVDWLPAQKTERFQLEKPNNPVTKKISLFGSGDG